MHVHGSVRVNQAIDPKKNTSHAGFPKWRKNGSWECCRLGPDGNVGAGHPTGLKVEIVEALIFCRATGE